MNMTSKLNELQLERAEMNYWRVLYEVGKEKKMLGSDYQQFGEARAFTMSQLDILAYNRVLGLGHAGYISHEQLQQIIDFYHRKKVKRFFIQISPEANSDINRKVLTENRFSYYNDWIKLYRPAESEIPVSDHNLRIDCISQAEADTFGHIICEAFEWPKELADIFAGTVGYDGYTHYLAYLDHKPIAGAALYVGGGLASMAIAATLPEFRGKGAQGALLRIRILEARRQGCNWILSETARETTERKVPSYRNMLRYGFREAYCRPNYLFDFNAKD